MYRRRYCYYKTKQVLKGECELLSRPMSRLLTLEMPSKGFICNKDQSARKTVTVIEKGHKRA